MSTQVQQRSLQSVMMAMREAGSSKTRYTYDDHRNVIKEEEVFKWIEHKVGHYRIDLYFGKLEPVFTEQWLTEDKLKEKLGF